jgi:hypothetical protein
MLVGIILPGFLAGSFTGEANDGWEFRADFRDLPDLRRRTKVELQSSVLIADPNLFCSRLEVEGDFFGDFRRRVGNRSVPALDRPAVRPSV